MSQVSYFDAKGGAARAAYRIHQALLREGLDSRMIVNEASSGDHTVQGPQTALSKVRIRLARRLGAMVTRSMATDRRSLHSVAVIPTFQGRKLNTSDADLIHLHWIAGEMLSIADIGRLRKPVVWTLHDMWAFCGAEHVTNGFRWREGYRKNNRPEDEFGLDLNRWTWARKVRRWRRPIHMVAPSRWLANCIRESALMAEWPVSVVPNAIDTGNWQPVEKSIARRIVGLPQDAPLILFGAMEGASDPNKGFDLLRDALDHLRPVMPELQLVVIGQVAPRKEERSLSFPAHYLGRLSDDLSLRVIYSAADLVVIPSRIENLPNIGLEASACGTPVVSFHTGGMSDIIVHAKTGFLAKAFDTSDLANGISWLLSDEKRLEQFGLAARARAVANWSEQRVAMQYISLYKKVLGESELSSGPTKDLLDRAQ